LILVQPRFVENAKEKPLRSVHFGVSILIASTAAP